MSDFITIQISAKIYSGYQYKIPKELYPKYSEEEIINEVKIGMKNFFNSHNLYLLSEDIDTLKLHFHDKNTHPDNIIYLCDHC